MSTVTLIVTAGIAAYKALELTRLLRQTRHRVVPVLSRSAAQFITPLSLEAIAEHPVYDDLLVPGQESRIGHIQLVRDSDLILVAPASAHFMAQIALGLADDLPSTMLLANTAPVLIAPAMNHRMWHAATTQGHVATLKERGGVHLIGPNSGDMACGEHGIGRMAEPAEIAAATSEILNSSLAIASLRGVRTVVTGGPTHEPIDPVRYLGNRSSGHQAKAIVANLVAAGAEVIFVHGPMVNPDIAGAKRIAVSTALEMQQAVQAQRDYAVFIAVAAVADWRVQARDQKIKKSSDAPMMLELYENPDILAEVAQSATRPELVIGFAAETEHVRQNVEAKLLRKGCDWLLASKISAQNPAFGQEHNHLWSYQRTPNGGITVTDWGQGSKHQLAARLVSEIAHYFTTKVD
ncbi:MAG: bifunctional phosphopantothenoylcysteine decarboxylase/phosphopantothenate--cysteine ligase CoaBC [Alphaproteobacteria bacterium]|nr:bifunctional phosphopantothenoylcysteine decarboxylase/phosphopantothenate--cysteine ligase CoaBC [Alphaproteobacteria bacterium]